LRSAIRPLRTIGFASALGWNFVTTSQVPVRSMSCWVWASTAFSRSAAVGEAGGSAANVGALTMASATIAVQRRFV
jgi:hypothetical protein